MSNLNDTEIQRLFEEAEVKATSWEMLSDTRRASTDSITTEFLEELAEEESANASTTTPQSAGAGIMKPSHPMKLKIKRINWRRNRMKS